MAESSLFDGDVYDYIRRQQLRWELISSEQGWIFVGIIGLVKNNQWACLQDDGDCILNNDALMMAVVLLFDSAVNDYGGDSDSGDSLFSSEEESSSSTSLMYFIIIYDGNRPT